MKILIKILKMKIKKYDRRANKKLQQEGIKLKNSFNRRGNK